MDTREIIALRKRSQYQLGWWLIILLGLFTFRVVIQLQVMAGPIEHFPKFDDWHSAIMPYPLLYSCQAMILAAGGVYIWRLFTTSVIQNPKLGNILYVLGWIYWLVMFIRLMLGLTLLVDIHWFSQTLPALFHLLLANILLLVGQYHRRARVNV